MLKVGRHASLYHKFTAYAHVIAYARPTFVVFDMEVMINYIAARKICHAKVTLTPCVMQYTSAAVLYSTLLDHILRSYYLVYFLFITLLVALLSHKHVIPATLVALCFLPPQRVTVTNGKGSLFPLDKLKLLVSNVGLL